jgi:Concanavalin A-like lectin/glucanases superfamily/HYR domain/Domain of unknown function DUF11/Leucine rich repeat/Secretion system C-terminal sorting domain/CARDB
MSAFIRLPYVFSLLRLNIFLLFSVSMFGQTPCATDTIAPVFQNCPANINLTTAGTNAIATWASPTATDNCSGAAVNLGNYSSGFAFPLGVSNVVFAATDAKGNQGFCRFNVAVTSQSVVKDVCANPATNIIGKANSIVITGIKTGAANIQIFNSAWNNIYNKPVNADSVTIPNLEVGTYNVKVTVLESGGRWPALCEVTQSNVVVTAAPTNACANGTLSFDGINDFILTNQAAIPANTDFTFETLCKSRATDTVCSGFFKRLFTLTLDNSNERLEIGDCSGQLTVYRNTPTASNGLYQIANANTLRNGAWHHVAAVKKSDSLYVYYDGVKVLTIGGVATINSVPRRFVMGSWVQNSDNWRGEMDEVRIWNYAASSTQIQTLKQCQLAGNESGLVLYYQFNQGVAGGNNPSELTVLDKSASANNATLNQFSLTGATSNWICSSLTLTQGCPINACENDVIAPVFANCPTNINLTTSSTTAITTWSPPTATDNCGTPSVLSNYNSGFAFPVGTTVVTYTATDAKGNRATCSFNVVVAKLTAPKPDLVVDEITWDYLTSQMYSPGFIPIIVKNIGIGGVIGSFEVKLYVSEDSLYSSNDSLVASGVNDNAGLEYLQNQTQFANLYFRQFAPRVIFGKKYWFIARVDTKNAIDEFNENNNTLSRAITTITHKNLKPSLQLTNTLNVNALLSPNSTVNYGETINIFHFHNAYSGTPTNEFPKVNYRIFLSENDTIFGGFDRLIGSGITPIGYDKPSTDNGYFLTSFNTDVLRNYRNGKYYFVVQYDYDDAFGESNEQDNFAYIPINWQNNNNDPCLNDTIPPVLSSCPSDIILTTTGTSTTTSWTPPTATDNCNSISLSASGNTNPGYAYPIGVSTITYTASDNNQNKSTCSFTITVTKLVLPEDICVNPTAYIVGGAGSITISNITSNSAVIQIFTSNWSSVFNQQVSTSNVVIPNLAVGNYIVKVTVLGAGGKWPAVCNLQLDNVAVTSAANQCVTDVVPPTFTNCPTNINLRASGTTTAASWITPTATDNCGTPSVLSNYNSGFAFPLGNTKVIYTATDGKGNKSTCSFDVNISLTQCGIDTIKPVIRNCPPDQTITTTGTTATATWTLPTATDNCGLESFGSGGNAPGQTFYLGSNIVSYWAVDSSNNQSACIFFINVVKPTASSDICTNPSANVVGGDGIITVNNITTKSAIIQVFSTGWISVAYFKATTSPFVLPNIPNGTYYVKITVLNAGGNWPSICTVQADNVVVGIGTNPCATDVVPPTIVNCPANINLTTSGISAVGTWVAPTATDNCTASPTIGGNYSPGNLFSLGTTLVTYTASDISGNKSTCYFNVAVAAPNNTCRLSDSLALVDLYNSTNGANWTTKWDLNAPISTWYGLDFNFIGCLRQINIPNNNLVGTIPVSIGNMVELDYLNLSKNKLTGVIPTTIGKLSKLTRLFLNYNQLSGSIPSEIGNLPVIFLELTKNQLTGSIPQNLGKLQYPVSITLDSNLLTGCIPIEMKSFCNSNNIRINANVGLPNGGDWAAFCSTEAGSCSANTVNDLALSIAANPSVFKKFSDLSTTITLKNNSNQAMTNIEVSVPTPKGVAAGRPAAASVGNWQPYCSGGALCNRWVIQTLAANATATLAISYYVLDADTAIVATARLNASTPADNTPANNFASIAIAPAPTQQIAALSIRKPTQYIPVIIQKISPNPTDGDVYIDVESLDERDMRFEFFNAQGQNVYNEMQHLKKGSNQLYFNITDKESGLYFVKPETSGGRNVPVKFVKL